MIVTSSFPCCGHPVVVDLEERANEHGDHYRRCGGCRKQYAISYRVDNLLWWYGDRNDPRNPTRQDLGGIEYVICHPEPRGLSSYQMLILGASGKWNPFPGLLIFKTEEDARAHISSGQAGRRAWVEALRKRVKS